MKNSKSNLTKITAKFFAIYVLLTSSSAMAGQLSFMTSKGVTDVADSADIVESNTAISINSDNTVSIELSLTDAKKRTCHIQERLMPKTDFAQLAIAAVDTNMVIVCKVNNPVLPAAGYIGLAEAVWLSYRK